MQYIIIDSDNEHHEERVYAFEGTERINHLTNEEIIQVRFIDRSIGWVNVDSLSYI